MAVLTDMRAEVTKVLREAILRAFSDFPSEGLPGPEALETPPDASLGDYAFPCFRLSKALRMGPPAIALKLAKAVDAPEVATAQAVGGYVNFFFNRLNFARLTLDNIKEAGDRYGGEMDNGKTVVLDYSSINIAKRFHIGHLSTTVIGHSLKRIYDHLGWKTIGVNHLGDWGTQFGKMIAAFKRWGDWEMVEAGGVDALTALYVRFHQEAEENPALEDEGRKWFKKIEDGDKEAMEIFQRFKDLTLKDAKRVYDILGVTFDSYNGEAFYNDKMGRVIDELKEKNLLSESQGALVVNLAEDKMPPCLIVKSDGATLYATRDLAAALWRKDNYNFDKCLYVVAYQQNLHFQQVFKVLELMGYQWAKDEMEHVAFGMVSYEGQSMSTRQGNIIYLDELLSRAREKALDIIREKSPDLENPEDAASQVGVGAVVFTTLLNNRIKDIDFWWDRALNFDGDTGPYTQYTHARCASVLRRAKESDARPDDEALTNDEARAVLRALARFPEAIRAAQKGNEPSEVTRATLDVAKAFNKYYYEQRILDEDEGKTQARLELAQAVKRIIALGLYLIGVKAPEAM
ncbi:MAG: arginine--tRNA ligase [Eubacteriales bacterium]|nr:arginine--tRNA ligase [Eubacteriales bacterium]